MTLSLGRCHFDHRCLSLSREPKRQRHPTNQNPPIPRNPTYQPLSPPPDGCLPSPSFLAFPIPFQPPPLSPPQPPHPHHHHHRCCRSTSVVGWRLEQNTKIVAGSSDTRVVDVCERQTLVVWGKVCQPSSCGCRLLCDRASIAARHGAAACSTTHAAGPRCLPTCRQIEDVFTRSRH